MGWDGVALCREAAFNPSASLGRLAAFVRDREPEFYQCDLEEVAHAVVSRVEAELVEYLRARIPLYCPPLPSELQGLLNSIRVELSEPGYVEGLLPQ